MATTLGSPHDTHRPSQRPNHIRQKRILACEERIRFIARMKARFTYWQERDGRFLGYLNDYPDHWTQGDTLDDLKDHLRDLFQTFTRDPIPGIRKVEDLEVA